MASDNAMVGAGGFAALAMLDEEDDEDFDEDEMEAELGYEEKGQENNSTHKGKKAAQPANQQPSALEVGDPFLNANNNSAGPWSVMVSGASGVPQEFSLAFLKDFKKPTCPRKSAALKAWEKELVVETYKKARKTEKKERAKEAKERAKLAAAARQPAPAPAPKAKAKAAAKRPRHHEHRMGPTFIGGATSGAEPLSRTPVPPGGSQQETMATGEPTYAPAPPLAGGTWRHHATPYLTMLRATRNRGRGDAPAPKPG